MFFFSGVSLDTRSGEHLWEHAAEYLGEFNNVLAVFVGGGSGSHFSFFPLSFLSFRPASITVLVRQWGLIMTAGYTADWCS